MQNFTLGKNVVLQLFFTLFLLIGSAPSFGQTNCPTVSDNSQSFCYLATVDQLQATPANGSDVRWYRNTTSNTAIPSDELLQDGTYYAGNSSATCKANRVPVTVTVDDYGAPDPLFGNVFSPCVYGPEPAPGDPDPDYIKTVKDLIDNIQGNDVEIFDEEFDEVKLDETTALVRGENYFAGQRNPNTGCTTSRVAIRYDPIYTPAPAADAIQIVCEGSTVADLQASATTPLSQGFRWYSTATSQPALANSTLLIDGEDYYVSQIVNRSGRNEPPCESTDRVMVTVQFDDIEAGNSNSETYCKSEFDAQLAQPSTTTDRTRFEELFLQLLDSGVPQDGTFNPEPTDTGNAPETYTTTYTVTSSQGCEDSVELTIIVTEDPTLTPVSEEVCRNTLPESVTAEQVEAFFRGLVAQAGNEAGGTFNNDDMSTIASQFNSNPIGTFSSEYTIREGTACETFTTIQIEVIESPNAGADNSANYCDAEIQNEFDNGKTFEDLFTELLEFGEDPNGEFIPTPVYSGPGTYTSEYKITSPNGCTDSAEITIIVDDPSAGDDNMTNQVCRNELPESVTRSQVEDFFRALLSSDADSDGTFSNDDLDVITADFNSNNTFPKTYNTTYTVSEGTACEDSTNLSVTILASPDAGEDNSRTYCSSEIEDEFDNGKTFEDIFTEELDDDVSGGSFKSIPEYDGPGTYEATYEITASNGCEDSSIITIIVDDNQAGDDNLETEVCRNELPDNVTRSEVEDFFRALLSDDANPNGTFSNMTLDEITEDFNSNTTYPKTYETVYTVGEGTSCEDSAVLRVKVLQSPNAGPNITETFCVTEFEALLNNPTDLAAYLASLSEGRDPNGEFVPSLNGITAQFSVNPIGTFSTTYIVDNGDCEDSATISITVTDREDANAGDDVSLTFCTTDEDQDLYQFLSNGADTNGTFDGYPNGVFSPSSEGAGEYTFNYTVTENTENCTNGTDSATFKITVNQGVSAGNDKTSILCRSQVRNIYGEGTARNYYLSLLDAGVPRTGTFNPTIQSLVDRYNNSGEKLGNYSSTYTIGNDLCSDSAIITVEIVANTSANAGDDVTLTFCSTEDEQNLFDYLSADADKTGSFAGYPEGKFVPSENIGTTTVIYTVVSSGSQCTTGSESSTFNITVNEPQEANAGGPVSVTFFTCEDQDIALTTILGEGALTTGSFSSPYEDGFFNPAEAEVGEYVITYTVSGAENCAIGSESTTLTISVKDLEAPEAQANQTFCLVDFAEDPKISDLEATPSEGLVWYNDAELTNRADLDQNIFDGESYYAVIETENGNCNSEVTIVTVSIDDSLAPTLEFDGDKFCRKDKPTVADLIARLNGDNIFIYHESNTSSPISDDQTLLINGDTYFATDINSGSDCESSERLPITVDIAFCGIPEGFSPNDDGINDRFVIPDIREDYPNFRLEVYNRWEKLVYKGGANLPDWDGTSNQSSFGDGVLPVGYYFYILYYNDGQTEPVQGKVYLSR